jgi:hypothetical protein
MKALRRILILLHFFIIILGVSGLKVLRNPVFVNLLSVYNSFTNTNGNFSFFAPNVGDDYSLNLKGYGVSKFDENMTLFPETNNETRLRYRTLLWHFFSGDKDMMALCSRSWAIFCMNKDLSLDKVVVSIYENSYPSMSEYRKGKRLSANLVYESVIDAK